jgi:peptide/nickel transport system permease protein
MARFVLRRCALVLPSLLGLLVVTFLLIHAVPSDPAVAMAGDAATPEQIARLRALYGLDQPIWTQFFVYVGKVLQLDFGESAFSHRPVATDIFQRLPATLELTFCSLFLSIFIGVPLGVVSALNPCWASQSRPSGSRSCCSCCSRWISAGCRCAATSRPLWRGRRS